MMKVFTLLSVLFVVASADYIPVIVEDSGTEYVEKFDTVIEFYIDVVNNGKEKISVTVTPDKCCLFIAKGDTNCDILKLNPPVTIKLGARIRQYHGNNSGKAVFLFRNLYTRYRKGNCSFEVTARGRVDMGFKHTLKFDTTPDGSPNTCSVLDQDPDRQCAPADCAIKYKGQRNFYRSRTGKCERVVQCDTRGEDGVKIVAYYDWENNLCHQLNWLDENSFSQIESDSEIPAEIDPSQSLYFPNLGPQHFQKLTSGVAKLICNNGVQDGAYCDCEEGWMSSGVHEDDPLNFYWCDTQMVDRNGIPFKPVKMSKPAEIVTIILLSLLNVSLSLMWFYAVYVLACKGKCSHITCCKREPSYTLLQQ